MSAIFNFDFSVYTTCQFNSIQFILFSIIKKIKTIKPQGKKNEQMEEAQREAKACKSCTPFRKLDIYLTFGKKKIMLQQTIQQNKTKQAKFT